MSLSLANCRMPACRWLTGCICRRRGPSDRCRRKKAGVPAEIGFQTKPEIALDQLRAACVAGLPRGVALMDAGYGANRQLRVEVTALSLTYIAGIMSDAVVWPPGMAPLLPSTRTKLGKEAVALSLASTSVRAHRCASGGKGAAHSNGRPLTWQAHDQDPWVERPALPARRGPSNIRPGCRHCRRARNPCACSSNASASCRQRLWFTPSRTGRKIE